MLEQLVPACRDSICGCDFVDVMQLVQNIMTTMIYLGTFVLVLLLVYVGYLYITSAANPASRTKARSVAISSIVGFVVMMGGFLIVSTIMSTFANQDEYGEWTSFFGIEKDSCEDDLIFNTGGGNGDGDVRVADVGNLSQIKEYIRLFIETASANGLNAIYEVRTASQREYLINNGVPASNVLHVRQITAPHFSVYSSYGSSGTGSNECHECVDLNDYGIQTKDGDRATREIAEGLSRVSLNESIPGFRVTEAYPKTVNHASGCHNDGTCVDVNFRF